jgi:predicted O-methyltransferase YrrM
MSSYSLATFSADVVRPANALGVLEVCRQIELDSALVGWSGRIERLIEAGEVYWDLACALRQISEGLQPRNYLEIGVRVGKSASMVASAAPDVGFAGFDLWVSPYAGLDNPGPDHVRRQLARVGHRGAVSFFDGDSRSTVPQFLEANPGLQFDLVNVDGDHSDEGAWIDLVNVAPVIAPGGYLVFDELTHPAHTLLPIWRRFQETYAAEFDFVENLKDNTGTGVARRRD